jgi:iron complex transport system permease protein
MRTAGHLTAGRLLRIVGVAAVIWLAAGIACLFWGQARVSPREVMAVLSGSPLDPVHRDIILGIRLPRVLMGLIAGGVLAVAGASFQALLRNPLATPHTLGVSAGASLGAVCAMALDISHAGIGPLTSVQVFALAGGLVNVGIIYALASGRRAMSPLKLLLAGVTLGLISSALIMFARFVSEPGKQVETNRWLMGGLDIAGLASVAAVLPFVLPAVALLLAEANALNQLSLGEEAAMGRGVNVASTQRTAFLAGSVATAAVVSVAGPIGFVGLIVPHVLRGLLGPDHRILLPLSLLLGGAFLVVADTVARSAFAPSDLPVGVLTAMLGGPFFLVLLLTRARYR